MTDLTELKTDPALSGVILGTPSYDGAVASDADFVRILRACIIGVGIISSILFIVIGMHYELQMYGDGSIFSYAVAVEDPWAFHWHDISDRAFVYLFSHVPSEIYVALTRDAAGGVALYGFLQFVAPLMGLALTWAADRSKGRIIFVYACASTACLCPLVFGFPTEMWVAHCLFWPALAICHYAGAGIRGTAAVFAVMLALAFTHPGALVLECAILATLVLRGINDAKFRRAALAFAVAVAGVLVVKEVLPPDGYMKGILYTAAFHFIDISTLGHGVFLLLAIALASYCLTFLVLRPLGAVWPHVHATAAVAVALTAYWIWFDHSLHAEARYPMRTALLVFTPILGGLAAAYALEADGNLKLRLPVLPELLPRLMAALRTGTMARTAAGALALIVLVHTVETAKFVTKWAAYKNAVRALAMGTASDPALGDLRFVSTTRISADLNRLSWYSTTEFLSILVAPAYKPRRLVLDPTSNFVWLYCKTATANYKSDRAVPAASRDLVRVHACLHG